MVLNALQVGWAVYFVVRGYAVGAAVSASLAAFSILMAAS